MANTRSPVVQGLTERIADVLQYRVRPLFKPGAKLTLIARYEDTPDADVLVTSDTDEGIRAVLDRSAGRPATETYRG